MAAGSTDVVVKFLADVSDISEGVRKIEGTTGRLKSWAKGIGATIAAGFAIDKVKGFIEAGADLQDQMSASQQIFGGAAKTVKDWSKTTASGFGVAQSDALKAANLFATFGKSAGLSGEDLAGFSTGLTGLAGDFASFRGTTPEQAIEAIGAALRGETEPIRAYGVLLDDATLRARAMKLGLISTTKEALTPQQKVLAAQAEILAQAGDAQGDFARTSDSAANQQKILSAKMKEAQAAIGTALLPAMVLLAGIVTDVLLPAFEAVFGWIGDHLDVVAAFAIGLGAVGAVILISLVPAFIAWAAAAFTAAAATLLAMSPLILIGIAVAALAFLIIKHWDTIVDATKTAWDAVLGFIQGVWDWISNNWPLLLAILTGPFGLATLWVISNWQTILDFFKKIPGWIGDALSGLADIILAPFKAAWDEIIRIKDAIVGIWQSAIQGAKDVWNAFARFWNGINVTIGGQDPLGPLGPSIPEVNLRLPHIPELAAGGITKTAGLAFLHPAEVVAPLDRFGGNVTINITTTGLGADAPQIQRAVVAALRGYTARNGPLPADIVS